MLGAAALVLFGSADLVRDGPSAALIDIIFAVAIVFWRRLPGLGLAIAWIGALVQIATVDGLIVGDLLILGAVFATGLAESRPVRWAGIASSIVGGGVAGARLILFAPPYGDGALVPTDPVSRGFYFVVASGVIAAALALFWTLGVVVRNRRSTAAARSAQERERIVAEATLTQERERALLSREMHDLVGHALAVVIAQSDGARYAKLTDPDAETVALATINRTARTALDDVHELLQVLRDQGESRREPFGVADLGTLLASVRDAGLHVTLHESGDRQHMSAAHELALYRVLQESLTNAIKHAGRGTDVQVILDWQPGAVMFRVLTTEARADALPNATFAAKTAGRPTLATVPERPAPLGQGLIGMHERMRLLGGTVHTGARTFGVPGYIVEGRLPFNAPERQR
ncbi:MAG: hypothetical protein JWQ64_3291 [Subtercola sp.]|nr:hypothetical protein [Subtercola sp.]